MGKPMTDREAYPAALITLLGLSAAFLVWRFLLGSPTLSGCWIWSNWGVYCPGCGGTRALEALASGHILQALRYHAALVLTLALAAGYLLSQTIWRLRGHRGWVLHYDPHWPRMLVALFLAHGVIRNFLWLCFGIPI